MCLYKKVLMLALPLPKVESFERYVVVAPHDDDIEIGMGATLAKLVREGKKVTCIICTDGRYGTEDKSITAEQLVEIRKKEAIEGLKILGVEDVVFLGFSDGGFYDYNELKDAVMKELLRVRAEFVFAVDYKMPAEHHIDHLNAGRAVADCVLNANWARIAQNYGFDEGAGIKGVGYYYTDKPNTFVKIKKSDLELRFKAIDAHVSQFPNAGDLKYLKLYMKLRAAHFGLGHFKGRADAFRVLGTQHMHCAPEIC